MRSPAGYVDSTWVYEPRARCSLCETGGATGMHSDVTAADCALGLTDWQARRPRERESARHADGICLPVARLAGLPKT